MRTLTSILRASSALAHMCTLSHIHSHHNSLLDRLEIMYAQHTAVVRATALLSSAVLCCAVLCCMVFCFCGFLFRFWCSFSKSCLLTQSNIFQFHIRSLFLLTHFHQSCIAAHLLSSDLFHVSFIVNRLAFPPDHFHLIHFFIKSLLRICLMCQCLFVSQCVCICSCLCLCVCLYNVCLSVCLCL